MKRIFLSIVVVLSLFVVSCSKSADATNTFNATVNGQQLELALSDAEISYVPVGNAKDSVVSIVITGAQSDYSKIFIFNLTMNKVDTGTFYFNKTNSKLLSLQGAYKVDTTSFLTQNNISSINSGFILISSISDSYISGSFAFSATNTAFSGLVVDVKDGSFMAKIK